MIRNVNFLQQMTKKIVSLLLVLFVILPGLSFFCDCCPAALALENSPATAISSPECSCCPDAIKVTKDDLATRSNQEFLISSLVRLFTLSFIVMNGAVEPLETPARGIDSSPPGRSSDTPLYLALEVLRL